MRKTTNGKDSGRRTMRLLRASCRGHGLPGPSFKPTRPGGGPYPETGGSRLPRLGLLKGGPGVVEKPSRLGLVRLHPSLLGTDHE